MDVAMGPGRWREIPATVSALHLRQMVVRDPHLVVTTADHRTLTVRVPDRARWTVGRDPACDLVVDWDGSVSRSHAILERLGPLVMIEDSGFSRNGTLVGGRRISSRTPLADTDQITLGYCVITVRSPEALTGSSETIGVEPAHRSHAITLTPAEQRVVLSMLGSEPAAAVPTNRQIAETLGLSIDTIKTHLRSITSKLAEAGEPQPISRERLVRSTTESLLGPPAAEPGEPATP